MNSKVEILRDPAALATRAAEWFVRCAVNSQGRFTVALSGGATPAALYTLLASSYRDQLDWRSIQFFFGDERAVSPDHPDSNYRQAQDLLFDPLGVPPTQIHRMKGEMEDLREAASQYAEELRPLIREGVPCFDLILLGLGADGHTASLFPGSPVLQERTRWVVPVLDAPKPPPQRLTLTVPVFNAARHVVFLVTGVNKAAVLREVLSGTALSDRYPATLIRPEDGLSVWLVDEQAAARLHGAA